MYLTVPLASERQIAHIGTDKVCAAVPVLLLTAEDDAVTHAETLRAVGVITKPFDPDDLLDAVSAAIGSHGSAPDGIRSTRPWSRTTHRPPT